MDGDASSIDGRLDDFAQTIIERDRKQMKDFYKMAIKYPLIAAVATLIIAPIASRVYTHHEIPLYYHVNQLTSDMFDAERRGDMLTYNILRTARREAVHEMWFPGTIYPSEFLESVEKN